MLRENPGLLQLYKDLVRKLCHRGPARAIKMGPVLLKNFTSSLSVTSSLVYLLARLGALPLKQSFEGIDLGWL